MEKGKIKKWLILTIVIFFTFFAFKTKAAILYFVPEKGEYSKEDIFVVNLMIETEIEKINAAQVELIFPPDKLEVLEISKGESIFNFWPEEPSFSNETGKIFFVGGLPLGFEGKGKIISIAFKVILKEERVSFAEISFSNDNLVFLNDGLGTPAKLQTKKSVFTLLPEKKEIPKNEWLEKIAQDKNPPEPFEIELAKDPLIFDGKYFIAFQTIDKESGVDHYEIKEGKRGWKRAKSPYLLEDQKLNSEILVKAVDKVGNERISKLPPKFPPKPFYKLSQFYIFLALIIGIIGIVLFGLQKLKKKRRINF